MLLFSCFSSSLISIAQFIDRSLGSNVKQAARNCAFQILLDVCARLRDEFPQAKDLIRKAFKDTIDSIDGHANARVPPDAKCLCPSHLIYSYHFYLIQ